MEPLTAYQWAGQNLVLPGSKQLASLSQGVSSRRRVWLRYLDERRSATERDFDPYGVVQRGGHWYAAGYCHLRRALRVFRVDRIAEVRLLEPAFEPPEDFDVPAFVSHAVAMMPLAYSAEVLLKTDLEAAQRELYPNFVTLEVAPEGVTMRCTIDNLRWLARVMTGLSFPWEVREPPELEVALREHVAGILEQLKR